MLGLRNLRTAQCAATLRRCNATLQTTASRVTSDIPPPEVKEADSSNSLSSKPRTASSAQPDTGEQAAKTIGRRRPGKQTPQRPAISSEHPRKYNRPIKEGVLPAYDLALKLLQTDSIKLKEEANALRVQVEQQAKKLQEVRTKEGAESEQVKTLEAEVEKGYKKLRILEVQSGVNLPEHRWRVRNAMGMVLVYCGDVFTRTDDTFKRICQNPFTDISLSRGGEQRVIWTCSYVNLDSFLNPY
jgi:large subunit ribosomal protein L35